MKSPIFVHPGPNKPFTLFNDTSNHACSAVLKQEYTTSIDGKAVSHQHQITYVSGIFQGSQFNQVSLTKEAIYISVKKLSFYLADLFITLEVIISF